MLDLMCPNVPNGLSLNKKPSDERNDMWGLWPVSANAGTLGWHAQRRESFRSNELRTVRGLEPRRELLGIALDDTGMMKLETVLR
jgi:hypothetical protein